MRGIKNLAQHLNISIGTVSRALNNRPDVSPETRQRVLEAANNLGYVANQSGRSLRQGTTNVIGFMIELSAETATTGASFFMTVFEGVTQVLSEHGLDLVVLPCSTERDPVDYLRRIVGRKLVDGVILSATLKHDDRIAYLTQSEVPFIALGRSETPGDYPWIDLDFESFVDVSVDRLVGLGHKRIALAVPPTDVNLGSVLADRFAEAHARNGLALDRSLLFRAPSSERGGSFLADRILEMSERPTAVLVSYELIAVGLYGRLQELDMTPGSDLAIIGMPGSPHSKSLRPSLTSFSASLVELGHALGNGLVDEMKARTGPRSRPPLQALWPLTLVPGESDQFDFTNGQ